MFKKIFAKLRFPLTLLKKPSVVCLVFKTENKWISKLQKFILLNNRLI